MAQPANVAASAPKKPITDTPTPTQPQIIPALAIPDPDVAPAERRISRAADRPNAMRGRSEQDRQDRERAGYEGAPAVGRAAQAETDHAQRDRDRRDAGDQRTDREAGCDRRHPDIGVRERSAADRLEPVDAGQSGNRDLARCYRLVTAAVAGRRAPGWRVARRGVARRRVSRRRITRAARIPVARSRAPDSRAGGLAPAGCPGPAGPAGAWPLWGCSEPGVDHDCPGARCAGGYAAGRTNGEPSDRRRIARRSRLVRREWRLVASCFGPLVAAILVRPASPYPPICGPARATCYARPGARRRLVGAGREMLRLARRRR